VEISLLDVQFLVSCVLIAIVSETLHRRSGTSREPAPVAAGASVRRRLAAGLLAVALVMTFLLLQGTAVTHVTTLHGSSANWTARYTVAVRQRPGAAEVVWRTALNASPTREAVSFPTQVHFELKGRRGVHRSGHARAAGWALDDRHGSRMVGRGLPSAP